MQGPPGRAPPVEDDSASLGPVFHRRPARGLRKVPSHAPDLARGSAEWPRERPRGSPVLRAEGAPTSLRAGPAPARSPDAPPPRSVASAVGAGRGGQRGTSRAQRNLPFPKPTESARQGGRGAAFAPRPPWPPGRRHSCGRVEPARGPRARASAPPRQPWPGERCEQPRSGALAGPTRRPRPGSVPRLLPPPRTSPPRKAARRVRGASPLGAAALGAPPDLARPGAERGRGGGLRSCGEVGGRSGPGRAGRAPPRPRTPESPEPRPRGAPAPSRPPPRLCPRPAPFLLPK